MGGVHKDVAHVKVVKGKLDLRTDAITTDAQREAGLPPSHVTESSAGVRLGMLRFEDDLDLCGGIGPNVSFHWVYLDDLISKKHFVILYQLSDRIHRTLNM